MDPAKVAETAARLQRVLDHLNSKYERKVRFVVKSPRFLGRVYDGRVSLVSRNTVILYRLRLNTLVHEFGHTLGSFSLVIFNPGVLYLIVLLVILMPIGILVPLSPVLKLMVSLIFVAAAMIPMVTTVFYRIDPRERFANRFLAENIEECKKVFDSDPLTPSL